MNKFKVLSILSFVSLIFVLSSVTPGIATTYYTHYYYATDTSVTSNTNWGSSNTPRYYVQASYYGTDGKWHDQSRVLVTTQNQPFSDSVNVQFLYGEQAVYQIDGNTQSPVRLQFSIGYSYSCGGIFTCSSSYYTGWWYLYPTANPYYYTYTFYFNNANEYSTFSGYINWY